ncbi:MAG TPA: CGNR zinc finger domain-containing protein [Candidatus Dormibacteraeota bacterium]|nr:CGNR zinc finger domain-containing protein [Candidatus Dormibacteraeota bacterium]
MSKEAPGRLQLVQDFINTADLETGDDRLATTERLEAWLTERRLVGEPPPVDSDGRELATALALREALRALCLANNGEDPTGDRLALLKATENLHLHLTARFGADGGIELEPDEVGVRHGLAEILTIVFESLHDGSWSRLKACASDSCQWAFYDHSRNRSGHWCSMEGCGNRAKVRSYRARQAPAGGA